MNLPPIPPNCPAFVQLDGDHGYYKKGTWMFTWNPYTKDPTTWSHDMDCPWVLGVEDQLFEPIQKLIISSVAEVGWIDIREKYIKESEDVSMAVCDILDEVSRIDKIID